MHPAGAERARLVRRRFPAALPFTATGYLVHLGRIHGVRKCEQRGDRSGHRLADGHGALPLVPLLASAVLAAAVAVSTGRLTALRG
ncbi:hypothetical protein [Streptomyces sp. NPDC006971]|uniref:hypothetical protein n=1 Tax=Streptomyces sp. NPDC006971 TaxID=3154784 RepID=UPI0033D7DAF1